MRLRLLAVVTLAALAVAATARAQDNTSFPPANGGTSVSNPASHYSFSDTGARGINPKTGIQVANVWGDVTKGAHGAFFRFDSGFVEPAPHPYLRLLRRRHQRRPGELPTRPEARETGPGLVLVSAR